MCPSCRHTHAHIFTTGCYMAATAVAPARLVARTRVLDAKPGVNPRACGAGRPNALAINATSFGTGYNQRGVPQGGSRRRAYLSTRRAASADVVGSGNAPPPVVAVVTTKGCPHCRRASAALRENGIAFFTIDASDPNGAVRDAAFAASRMTSVPQVWVGGELVGGANDTVAQLESGVFATKVNDAISTKRTAVPDAMMRVAVEDRKGENGRRFSEASASKSDVNVIDTANASNETEDDQLYAVLDAAALRMSKDLQPFNNITFGGWRNPLRVERRVVAEAAVVGWIAGDDVVLHFFGKVGTGTGTETKTNPVLIREIGRSMVAHGLMAHTDVSRAFGEDDRNDPADAGSVLFRLADHASAPAKYPDTQRPPRALNARRAWRGKTRDAQVVAYELRQRILTLYDMFLSQDGSFVDYDGMKKSTEFREYEAATEELQTVSLTRLSRDEKIAFFVNTYNALTVHVTVVAGPSRGFLDRLSYFDRHAYEIGGATYTCDDIEHGVLRGNQPGAASLGAICGVPGLSRGPFDSRTDPRRVNAITNPDPRVHFALVCGAKSCPPIRLYDGANIDTQLALAAAAFVESETKVERFGDGNSCKVTTSKIVGEWYKWDFGCDVRARITMLARFVGVDTVLGADLTRAAADENVTLVTNEYDWNLNGK